MPRSLLTNPARTAADRKLRNRILFAITLGMVAVYGGLLVCGVLPEVLRVPALIGVMLLSVAANAWHSWTRADWENRATRSKDEAREREERDQPEPEHRVHLHHGRQRDDVLDLRVQLDERVQPGDDGVHVPVRAPAVAEVLHL